MKGLELYKLLLQISLRFANISCRYGINKLVSPDINSDKDIFLIKPVSLNKIDKIIYDIKTNKSYEKEEKLKIKNYTLIPIQKKLISKDKSEFIKLTEKEVQILTELNNPSFISSKEYLLKKVWNYNPDINTTTVETHIHRLRKKLTKFSKTKLAIKYEKRGYYIT